MHIKVVDESDPIVFEDKVNKLMAEGYKISSTSCGFLNSESYDFCGSYQAILINERGKLDGVIQNKRPVFRTVA